MFSAACAELRSKRAENNGPTRLTNLAQRIRGIFKFGVKEGLLATPAGYGQSTSGGRWSM
ncbi:MAG: hypothetical protein AB7K24_30005 [Gemmataceae bacterium]